MIVEELPDNAEPDQTYQAELASVRPDPNPRLTMVIQLSHESFQEAATQLSLVGSANLSSKEQVYKRTFTVGQEPKPLDIGWLSEEAGYVIIENLEGTGLKTNPTKEESQAIAQRILILNDDWEVDPGLFFIGKHRSNSIPTTIRCQSGSARCRITVVPK